jgi:hypothetical protein
MGMTLHYRLSLEGASAAVAHRRLSRLRSVALDLPFECVEAIECVESRRNQNPWDDEVPPPLWVDSIGDVKIGRRDVWVYPKVAYGFWIHPGAGCESAAIGLCQYPQSITLPRGRRVRTKLAGWSWHSFCKTQYASNPSYGGADHFLRCHVSLIQLFDAAESIGFQVRVSDESGFYNDRDLNRLQSEVESWNKLIAGFVGKLKDSLPGSSEAPILEFPNFERLEASAQ